MLTRPPHRAGRLLGGVPRGRSRRSLVRIVALAGCRLAAAADQSTIRRHPPVHGLVEVLRALMAAVLVLVPERREHQRLLSEVVARDATQILRSAEDQRVSLTADFKARGARFAKHRDYARHSFISFVF